MIGSLFMKNMSSGICFLIFVGYVGHFFVSFCVSGTSFDVFGVLGTSGCSKQGTGDMPWSPLGSILAPFLRKIMLFIMFFLITFLDVFLLFFSDFGSCFVMFFWLFL